MQPYSIQDIVHMKYVIVTAMIQLNQVPKRRYKKEMATFGNFG